jgi:LysM repeat protein
MPVLLATVAVASVLLVAGCGGDDAGDTPPTTTATSATTAGSATSTLATSSASAAPSSSPSPGASTSATATGPSAAEQIAQDPRYFVYVVGPGDTLFSIADTFDAVTGNAGASAFATAIQQLNKLPSDAISVGQELAIPLRLPGDLSLFADSSMEETLGVGGAGGKILLLQPTLDLRSGLKGLLVLHRVRLADGKPASEGYGYVMEYSRTDRPPIKGGDRDDSARIAGPAFTVAAGSLVDQAKGKDVATFSRDGVPYAVAVTGTDVPTAQQLSTQLKTAMER